MSSRPGSDSVTTIEGTGGAAPVGADALLVVGHGRMSAYPLGDRELVIGRSKDCDVVVEHDALSRRHAVVAPGAPPTVRDLGSTNGTRIGGHLRHGGEPVPLYAGASFQIGPFTFLATSRARDDVRAVSGHEVLRVTDPTLAGATPLVRDVAASGANVLVLGETGTGKEVLATTIHELSRRGPLVRINCAAISEALLESELFGHEKGAFTGAAASKAGLLEVADGGTAFLDEIGELPPGVQAKLLRAVEQREVLRVGAVRPIPVDVRFVAATNRDLPAEVEAGRFRRDLYYRLDGVSLSIPPLRERRAMIGPLALHFLEEACRRAGRAPVALPADVLAALEAHPWPGNVRELKAVLERALLLARDRVPGVRDLVLSRAPASPAAPPPPAAPPSAPSPSPAERAPAPPDLTDDERADRDRVLAALDACAGNQTRAAQRLGISRTSLVNKLRLYRIPRPRS
jgi:two-component system, NtrC family, response regulator AtoC